ncbi:hypothetical protein O6H91_02G072500 [Diphasiastrum complanatum]|uniref:Uncharacterized protein n=1 Tax=Diphasiastrum complanatum TaxID=34168 RepID=A0ACC2EH66_DIPCM|nr:hypothetical protein O6H91_02G072500 [Diphasiastrum complanatum]
MGSTEEPERKRRHLNNNTAVSPPLKKQPSAPVLEEKKVDAAMLQYQNQKLVQQLDVQKSEIRALEEKFNLLKGKQASFDGTLITVNRCWNELVDDLELLAVRANAEGSELRVLKPSPAKDRASITVPPEETFLQRLLESGATENSTSSNGNVQVDVALSNRKAATLKCMRHLIQAIDQQRAKNERLFDTLKATLQENEASELLKLFDHDVQGEVRMLRTTMDDLHIKHKEIAAELRAFQDVHTKDQAELIFLRDELEETLADLESSRRKVASFRTQKDVVPTPGALLSVRNDVGESGSHRTSKDAKELEIALEEAQMLSARRLSEIQELHQKKLNLTEQFHKLQESIGDEHTIISSRPYLLLNEQVQDLRTEVERYRGLIDHLQTERDNALRRETEMALKAEEFDVALRETALADERIAALENELQQCMTNRDELQLRLEEASELSGSKDTVPELKVMITTLHKEMAMMQGQLNKYKEAAYEVYALRAEIQSIMAVQDRKVAAQIHEIQSMKEQGKILGESEQELKLILDMYGSEYVDSRDIVELQQAECRAWAQVERLKAALDEHSLELRVKAANEAEAACQQRLAAAEAEIAGLRHQLTASERISLELNETLEAKNDEGEAYIVEIETIGQAYEDMQAQNQRLLQQLSERDDYNTKLVSDSVRAKQLQAALLADKQHMISRLHHAISVADTQKQRVSRLEEQARALLDQLGKAAEEVKLVSLELDSARQKAAEVEKESISFKSALKFTQKELDEQSHTLLEAQQELEKERFEKKRMQDELALLNTKAARLSSLNEGGNIVEKLQEEIKEYKAILKCGVCHDRPKEVVITKCYHLFCGPCIQRNLEIRHRKCPGCGVPFGHSDVRTVYI